MGQLTYGGGPSIGLPDTELAYLDALTRHAFSEGKSFTVVIAGTVDEGVVAAQSLWFSRHIPIQFAYQGYETVQIDRGAFGELYERVSGSGMYFVGDGPLPYEFTGDHPGSDGGD